MITDSFISNFYNDTIIINREMLFVFQFCTNQICQVLIKYIITDM